MRMAALAVSILLGSAPAYAAGQSAGQKCEIQAASSSTRGTTFRDEGRTFMGGGVFFECPGGTTIRSDSLAHFEAAGMVEFFGNVHYADTVKTLAAEYVRYIGRIGQVIAQDSVVLSDIASGSQIRAPYLEYFQATETRPEALVRIPSGRSGRPRAILVSRPGDASPQPGELASEAQRSSPQPGEAGSGAADRRDPNTTSAQALSDSISGDTARITELEPTDTTFIDADAMDFYGQRLAYARGNVVVLRADMQAFGREAQFDQSADSMLITGQARVVAEDYKLHGDTIAALITPERELRQVNAWREARLESEDLEAEAPGLRILLENGEVNRMIALGERTGSRGAGAPLAGFDDLAGFDELAELEELAQPEPAIGRLAAMQPPDAPKPAAADASLPISARRDEGLGAGVQAQITSKDVRMRGDSIDALAPSQQIERVIAVGAAFGERLSTDTTVVRPAMAKHDWMSGDTIIATFTEAPDSRVPDSVTLDDVAPDSAVRVATAADTTGGRPERVLETLTAIADSITDARSLYAVPDEEHPLAPPALSYLIAQRIHVTLRDGEVLDVKGVGRDGRPVYGLYLEPRDSARADTVARTERDP